MAQLVERIKSIDRRILAAVAGLPVLLCLCCCGIFFLIPTDVEPTAAVALATGTDEPTNTAEPTDTAEPTEEPTNTAEPTEEPTETPTPTDTAEPTDTPTPSRTPTPTDTPTPSQTPTPSDTPTPSLTPSPTSTPTNTATSTPTPTPTNTATPTFTPSPTNTPSPTPSPTPLFLITGNGDDVVDVDRDDDPSLIRIVGNSAGRYFGVESYDDLGNRIDLLVNTTDPYDGVRPLDFLDNEHTTRFQITAVGSWTIEIWPLSQIARVDVPGTFSGVGDYVFAIGEGDPDLAIINGNAASRYFGVITWGESGRDLLVNTTDPVVDGRYIVSAGTLVFEVLAVGPWTIEVTE